ncbi:MAG: phage head closure protein [Pseudomonadota bacterium]|nr:phage head closure protein [Pseudomonadota bacterium]
MRAGALDRRVTIQRATLEDDGYGSVEVWADWLTVSAQIVQQGGREFLAAAQVQAVVRVLFRLRWIEGVSVLDRVVYDNRLHNIQEVRELGRREGLELMTVAAA